MKKLILPLFLFLFLSKTINGQTTLTKHAVGIDAITGFATLFGNLENYQILEVSYFRKLPQLDFRIKFNLNSNDFMEEEFVYSTILDAENDISYNTSFAAYRNYVLSVGLTRKYQKGVMIYYTGLDINMGLNAGQANSVVKDNINEANIIFANSTNDALFILGISPVIGGTINLFKRLDLSIEFALPLNYNFGEVSFVNEQSERNNVFVKRGDIGFDRLLNDIRFSYNF